MKRDQRFPMVMSKAERRVLETLARDEALSAASVVRRLIIREAKERGLWPLDSQPNEQAQAEQGGAMEANATLNLNDEARARLRAVYRYLLSLERGERTDDQGSLGGDTRQAANDTPPEEAEAGGPPCPGAHRPH